MWLCKFKVNTPYIWFVPNLGQIDHGQFVYAQFGYYTLS